jgi:FKBP-type peptidyl-prolyl cis-trans isomerase FkpA
VDNQPAYDDMVIQNFMKNNGYTGYTKIQTIKPTGIGTAIDTSYTYYKVLTAPTGTTIIDSSKTITYTATGSLLNNVIFNNQNIAGVTNSSDVDALYTGIQAAMYASKASIGTKISIFLPSFMAIGTTSSTGTDATGASVTIPSNSCMRFTFIIDTVTPD